MLLMRARGWRGIEEGRRNMLAIEPGIQVEVTGKEAMSNRRKGGAGIDSTFEGQSMLPISE